MSEKVTKKTAKSADSKIEISQESSSVVTMEPQVISGDVTPDKLSGVPDDFEYVGFWRRLAARMVDVCVILSVGLLISLLISAPLAQAATGISIEKVNAGQQKVTDRLNELVANNTITTSRLISDPSIGTNCGFLFDVGGEDRASCENYVNFSNKSALYTAIGNFIFGVAYFVLLTVSAWQGSLGKKVFGLKVANASQKKVSLLQSFAREGIWIANGLVLLLSFALPVLGIASLIIWLIIFIDGLKSFFGEKHQTFHDVLADTYVIKEVDML